MGISCLAYQYQEKSIVFDWENLDDRNQFIDDFRSSPLVIGFNSISFDDQLLRANQVDITTNFDILREIRIAAFGSPDWQDTPKGFSYSLDAITKANGYSKTGNGALAPEMWQLGKKQEIRDYCLNDVLITSRILNLALDGNLIDPNTGDKLHLFLYASSFDRDEYSNFPR